MQLDYFRLESCDELSTFNLFSSSFENSRLSEKLKRESNPFSTTTVQRPPHWLFILQVIYMHKDTFKVFNVWNLLSFDVSRTKRVRWTGIFFRVKCIYLFLIHMTYNRFARTPVWTLRFLSLQRSSAPQRGKTNKIHARVRDKILKVSWPLFCVHRLFDSALRKIKKKLFKRYFYPIRLAYVLRYVRPPCFVF